MPNCPYCSKAFGRISALQNHSAFCAIRHQGKYAAKNSTDELDIPPLRDMYIVLQKLVLENEKLYKKITQLEKLTNKEKKRVSLMDWLDTNKTPTIDFVDWVKNITVTQCDFHRILTVNIVHLIMDIIKNNLETKDIPICSFDQKLKTIFIYTQKSWRIVEKGEFYRFIDNIIRKLTSQLNQWMQRIELQLQTNEEKFHMYTKKIYSIDTEEVARRIHLRLYNHLKYNLRNIVEYEFTF
ncbi:MAG: hypothetical protein ACXADW_06530 [Candidatus Hodarchaeales archaeon]|jgi:hypothetical protein